MFGIFSQRLCRFRKDCSWEEISIFAFITLLRPSLPRNSDLRTILHNVSLLRLLWSSITGLCISQPNLGAYNVVTYFVQLLSRFHKFQPILQPNFQLLGCNRNTDGTNLKIEINLQRKCPTNYIFCRHYWHFAKYLFPGVPIRKTNQQRGKKCDICSSSFTFLANFTQNHSASFSFNSYKNKKPEDNIK